MANPRKERPVAYWLVNGLTCSRAAIAVGTVGWVVASGEATEAILVGGRILVANLVLDLMDGPLARILKVTSPEGAIRDALADGSMLTANLALAVIGLDKVIDFSNTGKVAATLGVAMFAAGFTAWRVQQENIRNKTGELG